VRRSIRPKKRRPWTDVVGSMLTSIRDFLVHHLGEHISPNSLTLTGVFFAVGCAVAFANGHFIIGACLLMVSGIFDIMDGAVARWRGMETKFGAFWDSTLDRVSDFFIFGGLIWYYADTMDFAYMLLAMICLCGSELISYTRARAECIIESCDVGFAQRPERVVMILAGAFLGVMEIVLWIIAIFSILTFIHRCWYTYLHTEVKNHEDKKVQGKIGAVLRVVFWGHNRATLAYDIKIGALMLLVFGCAGWQWLQPAPVAPDKFTYTIQGESSDVNLENLGGGQYYVSLDGNPIHKNDTKAKNELIKFFHDNNPGLVVNTEWEVDKENYTGFYATRQSRLRLRK
jgi:phosphatidylglycerophosphate synthase